MNYNSWFDNNQKNGNCSSSKGGEYVPPPLVVPFTPLVVSFAALVPLGWPRNTPQAILLIVSSGVSALIDEPKVPAYDIKQVPS
jgi:hypothetical protein